VALVGLVQGGQLLKQTRVMELTLSYRFRRQF
jgi:hypothetical protein